MNNSAGRIDNRRASMDSLARRTRGFSMAGSFHEVKGASFCKRVKGVVTNLSFLTLCLSLSGLYFVVTGIQYWGSDYLKSEFGPDGVSDNTVAIYFAATSLSAPISGAVAGGITTSYMGGYNNIKAQKLQYYMALCAVACALPVPFTNAFW